MLGEADRLERLTPPEGRVRVVIDTDTFNEIDDQFALVQALLSPERLDVRAVYACPFHNQRSDNPGHGMELSYQEILRILERMGRSAEGFAYRGVTDYVGPGKAPREAEAVEHLISLAAESDTDSPLYVVAIGAASNVASALLRAPELAGQIVLIWLGGNAQHWPPELGLAASFNLIQDVAAGQVVMDSGVPLVYVPASGVTSHLHSTAPEIELHVEPCGEIGAFLARRFKEYSTDHRGWSKPIWDMAAVGWLLEASWVPSVVRPTPRLQDDMAWLEDETRHAMRYAAYVERDPILRDFFDKLRAFTS